MSLQDAILAILARNTTGSCTLKKLRGDISGEPPQAVDAALVGLKRLGRIHIIGGVITRPTTAAMPVEVELTAELAEQRRIAREVAAKYRAANKAKINEYKRRVYALERTETRRKHVDGLGAYAAQRIRQIEGSGE